MSMKITSFLIIALLLPSLLFAAPIDDRVHTILLGPGVESVSLPLSGWLVDEGTSYTSTVAVGPRHGTWENEVYTPGPDFWTFGDSFSLNITRFGSLASGPEVIVLTPAASGNWLNVYETFEGTGGQLDKLDPAWSTSGSPLDLSLVPSTIEGQYGLGVKANSNNPGLHRISGGHLGNGTDQVGAEAEINLELPGGGEPGSDLGSGEVMEVSVLDLLRHTDLYASVRLRYTQLGPFLYFALNPHLVDCGSHCTTTPRPIRVSEPTRFSLWVGQEAIGHPAHHSGKIKFSVASTSVAATTDELSAHRIFAVGVRSIRFGAFDVSGPSIPLGYQLDNLRLDVKPVEVLPDFKRYAVDDFDNGGYGANWIADGPIHLTFASRDGQSEAAVLFQDLAQNGVSRAVLIDQSPVRAPTLRSSFVADLRNHGLAHAQEIVIYSASASDIASPESRLFGIRLRNDRGQLSARAEVLTANGPASATAWVPVTGVVPMNLYRIASDSYLPGQLIFKAGDQQASTGHWDSRNIESVLFGVQDYVVIKSSGDDLKRRGIRFDNLISTE